MALKSLLSFSTGELDPVLHDNVTLQKFGKGLATGRNIMIGKTGSILSRPARANFIKARNADQPIRIVNPPNTTYLLEWGLDYVRVYNFSLGQANLEATINIAPPFANVITDDDGVTYTSWTEQNLKDLHFVTSKNVIYVFLEGYRTFKIDYVDGIVYSQGGFSIPDAPDSIDGTTTTITGSDAIASYEVEYAASVVVNGEEGLPYFASMSPVPTVPNQPGESVALQIDLPASYSFANDVQSINQIRIYRRPVGGGVYGYIGSTNDYSNPSADLIRAEFIDLGANADFTNNPPERITRLGLGGQNITNLNGKTGAVYQQRLLTTTEDDPEAILASRPGFQNNFYRDFPYDSDSSLKFKSGTTGRAKVLRIIDNNGLIVFTTVGVYVNTGVLTIDNIALTKVGNWIIDETVEPLSVPDGVFFVDKTSNAIRQLVWSESISTYTTIEHSIFSNHIFREKTITSWGFQNGTAPIMFVNFSDGTFATFTYHYEHQLRAWTRGDSRYPIEQIEGSEVPDTSFFVVNKNGQRYVEVSLPRFVRPQTIEDFPEYDKLNFNFPMDGATTIYHLYNDDLVGDETINMSYQVDPDENDPDYPFGVIAVATSDGTNIFTNLNVGDSFRMFNPEDQTVIDFEIIVKNTNNYVFAYPTELLPDYILVSGQTVNPRIYEILKGYQGFPGLLEQLDHLEGESVTVVGDGYVMASPNNDFENYPEVTVTSGSITLPDDLDAAIIVVGRPFTMDIETLNITTVAQSPTTVESITVNKLYLRLYKSRGLFIGNEFPENKSGDKDGNTVEGMTDIDYHYTNDLQEIIGNKPKEPFTGRCEQTLPGNWDTQGKVSIRQVDPYHFEIISIIPDVEVQRRSNR